MPSQSALGIGAYQYYILDLFGSTLSGHHMSKCVVEEHVLLWLLYSSKVDKICLEEKQEDNYNNLMFVK